MLDWIELTTRQRMACVLLSLLFAAGIAADFSSKPTSPVTALEAITLVLFFASLLSNPHLVRGKFNLARSYPQQFAGKPFPAACKSLLIAALGAFVLSRVVNAVW